MRKNRLIFIFVFISVLSGYSQPKEYTWPLPGKWRQEIIPFPIGFAPELKYKGVEEVHFMPGWKKNDSLPQQFWSYSFIWYLDSVIDFSASRLERDLTIYFNGLQKAVMEGSGTSSGLVSGSHIRIKMIHSGGSEEFRGRAEIFDVFFTKKAVTLNLKISRFAKEPSGKTIFLFEFSPRPYEDEVWKELDRHISEFSLN
jgi:hypothetical protein